MPEIRHAERNKRPGVSYAVSNDGLELPVLDVTHPDFACELSEQKQAAMLARFLDEQRRFARCRLAASRSRALLARSRMLRLASRRAQLYGCMTTYVFKLGPKNLGSPFPRSQMSVFTGISVRRGQDMAPCSRMVCGRLVPHASRPLYLLTSPGDRHHSLTQNDLARRDHPLWQRPVTSTCSIATATYPVVRAR